jgi:hypothetical protein
MKGSLFVLYEVLQSQAGESVKEEEPRRIAAALRAQEVGFM